MKPNTLNITAWVAIAVIVVSLLNMGLELTGFATTTDTGIVNVTVESSAAINFTTPLFDFGSGQVDIGESSAVLDTNGTVLRGSWPGNSGILTVENIGNVNVSLGISSSHDASEYLGGTSPSFEYEVSVNESGSCETPANGATAYTEIKKTDENVCGNFPFDDAKDSVNVDFRLTIPSDGTSGDHSATITATGTYS